VKIYVGNLPFDATEEEVRQLFEPHGALSSVALVNDNMTGRFRGFGFVEMSDADAAKAITALNGTDLRGRALTVNESRPKAGGGRDRERGGRGGGYGNRRF
jgi:RNA recognition motif-containing protein